MVIRLAATRKRCAPISPMGRSAPKAPIFTVPAVTVPADQTYACRARSMSTVSKTGTPYPFATGYEDDGNRGGCRFGGQPESWRGSSYHRLHSVSASRVTAGAFEGLFRQHFLVSHHPAGGTATPVDANAQDSSFRNPQRRRGHLPCRSRNRHDGTAGLVKAIVPIDLPRPRDSTSDAFNRYRREIAQLIEVESRKVFAAATA